MKINYWLIGLTIFLFFKFISCSSTQEYSPTKKQGTDSSYIFDELPPEDFITIETPKPKYDEVYTVQIGAYSSFERAKEFAELSRLKLNREIRVSLNPKNNLYVIHIHPPFNTKQDAIDYCFKIRNFSEYRDAWIVTIKPGIK